MKHRKDTKTLEAIDTAASHMPRLAWTMPENSETREVVNNVNNLEKLDNIFYVTDKTEYSPKMSESIKQHLTNMQFLQQNDKKSTRIMDDNQLIEVDNETHNILRDAGESDDDYSRRIRKTNLLSLAQEFAALKQVQSGVPQKDHSPMDEVNTDSETDEEDAQIPTLTVQPSERLPKQAWPVNSTQR